MNYFSSSFTLGILGGGQLGKMMLADLRKFDIRTHVLDPSAEAPCQYGAHYFEQGDLLDFQTVYNFGKQVDVLTLEIENVNLDALEQLEAEGKSVYPSAQTLRLIQNKGVQKDYYKTHNIPSSPHRRFNQLSELQTAVANQEINLPFVWKLGQFGYDGKGVKIVRSITDLHELPTGECIAEELIPFTHELAVIVARSVSGEIKTYPVVEMEFHPEANQVEYVLCPARIAPELAKKATEIALQVSAAFAHVGILAVELFLTADKQILVNEVAPRPHNSGHYSIEASYTSQFENHIRAILDLPLGDTSSKVAGIMVNLVGAEGFSGPVVYENIEQIMQIKGVTPHLYGKKETRPFRKMGHVTIVHEDLVIARTLAEEVKQKIRVIS
ncbi:MAG: 5-(carboxyamino)imidazole ribonucleotide synthase [Flavobacterium sp.]|nr:5-(carboxyamino)imidazole ribonucleotide synthase [Flavobacterium sp.]